MKCIINEDINAILKKQVRENIYVSVAFPRFLYKMGTQTGWRQMIKANGGKVKDLKKCWEQTQTIMTVR